MRRRWRWPIFAGRDLADVVVCAFFGCVLWAVAVGLVIALVVGAFTGGDDAPNVPVYVCWAIAAFPLVVFTLIAVGLFLAWLWHERPRRVTEPVTEDLREGGDA